MKYTQTMETDTDGNTVKVTVRDEEHDLEVVAAEEEDSGMWWMVAYVGDKRTGTVWQITPEESVIEAMECCLGNVQRHRQ